MIYNEEMPIALQEDSPLIGAGTLNIPNYTFPETDIFGNPRIIGNTIDIGAIQFVGDNIYAYFTGIPLSGTAPLTVRFTDRSIGEVVSWAWDFNNDGSIDTTDQNPEFIYTEPGIYSVKLVINEGERETIRHEYITVIDGFWADFIAEPLSGGAPLIVQFTDTSTYTAESWEWDFNNDGSIDSTEQNPVFTYNEPGIYTVMLVLNFGEYICLKEEYITVLAPNVAYFEADPLYGDSPLTVQFTDLSTYEATTWVWDFTGDGEIDSTEQNPIFTYTEPGIYSVMLILDNGVMYLLREAYITVTEPLIVNFEAEPLTGHVPLTVQFFDRSTGNVESWEWDFQNNGEYISTDQNPTFTYTRPGTYTVKLTVNNGDGLLIREDYITTTVSDFDDVLHPLSTGLSSGYPNPFSDSTVFKADVSEYGFVTVNIYNVKGQKVRTLLNENKSMGSYQITWDGKDDNGRLVSSGIYQVEMRHDNKRADMIRVAYIK